MALPTPAPVLFNENLQINGGKRADGLRAKGLKPSENPGKQGRRALQNLSNISRGTGLKDTSTLKEKSKQKPRSNVTNTIKGTALKDKPILKEKSTQKQRSEALKNPLKILTDEEIKMCHEWAKDGVEGFHSTQNDSQKLDKDLLDKRVKKKVAAVNSALRGWSNTVFDSLKLPATEVAEFFYDEPNVLELEPEILPDISWRLTSSADDKAKMAEDRLDELDQYPSLENKPVMFELRDEDKPAIPPLGVY
ncbi:hypothetical protein BDA96_04G221900 [Sorghum bicolor]|uniref:Uncharacterized protein n=2 Tax=Sorghum bicolor TaxID=4558 RepID=A0A921R485_SORBI|nr:uncharacterized protein LOC8072433 [Sorghum bicolor]EES07118.1 hypothetical protein SORBI_3004G208100 [Sorghum bicolor]KAG0533774.1 hypothetical protein BDA96_04G221900 [Sorghum bicolor]|eukprot:XP_002454142.1 uncharacterized protein LOC8072433 [Sorghum bicolor]